MSITADEIPKAFEKQNIKNRAMTPLNFDKAEGATKKERKVFLLAV